MIISKLSDDEIVTLSGFINTGNLQNTVQYINRLLYKRNLGHDGCSRPLAFRDKKDMDEPCFAKGYLEKVLDFMKESEKRSPVEKLTCNVEIFIKGMVKEIDQYFKK